MKRPRCRSVAFAALFLAGMAIETSALHPCPHAHPEALGDEPAGEAPASGHGGAHGSGAESAASPESAGDHEERGCCCVDACVCVFRPAESSGSAVVRDAPAARPEATRRAAARPAPATRPPYFLPLPNGPPAR